MAAEATTKEGQEADPGRIVVGSGLLWGFVVAAWIVLMLVWFFFMTLDIRVWLLGLPLALVAIWVAVLHWVWTDANKQGMPGAMWFIVTLFLFALGLALYLVVREFRPTRDASGPTSGR